MWMPARVRAYVCAVLCTRAHVCVCVCVCVCVVHVGCVRARTCRMWVPARVRASLGRGPDTDARGMRGAYACNDGARAMTLEE